MSMVADYVYQDHLGRPVLRKIRSEPRRFSMQAALIKHNRFYWKSGPGCVERYQPEWATKALFDLPVLLDALRRGEPTFLLEGERDCQTFATLLRLPATTNWQGAGKFDRHQAEWFMYGGGRSDVTILMDRDNAGHFAGWQRYCLLREAGVAKSRIGLYRPASSAHKDVTDVAAHGLSGDAFRRVSPRLAEKRAEAYGADRAARYTFSASAS